MSLGICGLKCWQRVWFKRSGFFSVEFNTASRSNIRTQVPQLQTLRRREYSSICSKIAMLLATLGYCLLRCPKYNVRVRDISSSRLQLPPLKAHTLTFYLCLWSREIKGLRLMYQSRWRVSSHNKTHLASVSIRAQSPATHVSCILFWKGTRTSSSL